MFLEFFLFEIKLRLKSISTYCYFFVWVILTLIFTAAPDFFLGPGKILANGPFATLLNDFQFTFFGAIVIAAIFGTSILRDFQRDTYQLIFTKPISKFAYLGGRWTGSFITTIFVFTGIPVGEILGGLAPWADQTRLGPLDLPMLAYHYAVIVIPQVFFLGTLFFLVAALTRRVIVVYLQGVALYAIYFIGLVSVTRARSLKPFWPAVLDPVGLLLAGYTTRYWTPFEQNTLWVPLRDMFLWNRVVWGVAGFIALFAVFALFPMSAEALTSRRSRRHKKEAQESTAPPKPAFHNLLPTVLTVCITDQDLFPEHLPRDSFLGDHISHVRFMPA
jgi:ABC-type transport system involved in multi-copper enzyme maturation permease subunit